MNKSQKHCSPQEGKDLKLKNDPLRMDNNYRFHLHIWVLDSKEKLAKSPIKILADNSITLSVPDMKIRKRNVTDLEIQDFSEAYIKVGFKGRKRLILINIPGTQENIKFELKRILGGTYNG